MIIDALKIPDCILCGSSARKFDRAFYVHEEDGISICETCMHAIADRVPEHFELKGNAYETMEKILRGRGVE